MYTNFGTNEEQVSRKKVWLAPDNTDVMFFMQASVPAAELQPSLWHNCTSNVVLILGNRQSDAWVGPIFTRLSRSAESQTFCLSINVGTYSVWILAGLNFCNNVDPKQLSGIIPTVIQLLVTNYLQALQDFLNYQWIFQGITPILNILILKHINFLWTFRR